MNTCARCGRSEPVDATAWLTLVLRCAGVQAMVMLCAICQRQLAMTEARWLAWAVDRVLAGLQDLGA